MEFKLQLVLAATPPDKLKLELQHACPPSRLSPYSQQEPVYNLKQGDENRRCQIYFGMGEWRNEICFTLALTLNPLPQERKSPLADSGFADDRPANSVAQIFKETAGNSPSPWGEGRVEGERYTKLQPRGNVVGVVSAKLDASVALATSGSLPENVNYAVKSSFLLSFLESVPAVSAKLKEPITADRKFEDVVKSAQDAAVLVLVY